MIKVEDVIQEGPVVTVGRVAFDFGLGNIEAAWRFAQVLKGGVRLTVDDEPTT